MVSRTATHALRALVSLARLPKGGCIGAAELAAEIGAPRNYLGKLLHGLARRGLVASRKGFGGGFRLARPADRISLYAVVEPLDRVSARSGCILGRLLCSTVSACPLHHRWSRVARAYMRFLKETTLAHVVGRRRNTSARSGHGGVRGRRDRRGVV